MAVQIRQGRGRAIKDQAEDEVPYRINVCLKLFALKPFFCLLKGTGDFLLLKIIVRLQTFLVTRKCEKRLPLKLIRSF